MNYRKLGKTGLMVSEIGFGPEWMTGTPEETRAIAEVLREAGVNYLDCWGTLVPAGWMVSISAAVM